MNILQWNLNGFRTHYKELQIIIKEHIPTIIALQETNFKDNNSWNIKGYTKLTKNRIGAELASGGVATYIRNDIKATEIQLQTNIEAIAVQITLPISLCICNIYLPNSYDFERKEIESLIQQLSAPGLTPRGL